MILDKLRRILKIKNISVADLCSGYEKITNVIEFKNILRKVGVTSKDTDRIMEMVVLNKDGMVDLEMFT